MEINIRNPEWNQYQDWFGAITVKGNNSGNLVLWCRSHCLDSCSPHFTGTHVEQKQRGILIPKLKITSEVETVKLAVTANSKEQVNYK